MCFGKVFVTLLALPWLNNAMNRHEIKMFSGNNTVLILYKTPPDRPHHQLWRVLDHIQQEITQHTTTCIPGETGICITTNQVGLQKVYCVFVGSQARQLLRLFAPEVIFQPTVYLTDRLIMG
jgi:hypothetical protein